MSLMKILSLLFGSFLLGSCVMLVNAPQTKNVTRLKGTDEVVVCDHFIMPKLPALPKIPELSDKVIKDRHLTEDALILIISEHRNHIKDTQKILDQAYIEYTARCKSK